jgi:hypothetical protein
MNKIMNRLLSAYYSNKQIIVDRILFALNNVSIQIYSVILAVLNVIIWIATRYIFLVVGANQMALHYSVGFGIDYYGDAKLIYIIPLLGLFVILLNLALYIIVSNFKDKNFIAHILFASAMVVNFILLIAAYSVYIINF